MTSINMLGSKLRKLREANGSFQKEIATLLYLNVAYVGKMKNKEKPISRSHLKIFAQIYRTPEEELITIWLADKIIDVLRTEKLGLEAMIIVEKYLKPKKSKI